MYISKSPDYLAIALQTSVTLKILEIKRRGCLTQSEIETANSIPELIGEYADQILQTRTQGKTAKVFNALTTAIAVASFDEGGIDIFGNHWESTFIQPLSQAPS